MGLIIRKAHPAHPIYGFAREKIGRTLTIQNWPKKAVMRVAIHDAKQSHLLWVSDDGEGRGANRYAVCCVPDEWGDTTQFNSLDEALRYINGALSDTALARQTRPATDAELPPDEESSSLVFELGSGSSEKEHR